MELPGYDVGQRLGGARFAGRHRLDGAPVTVELLEVPDAAARARLLAAADDLRRLDDRALVRLRHVLPHGETGVAVVRDAVDGADLASEREAGRPLPAALLRDVLGALAVLHAAGVVHGALGPQAVLVDRSVPLRPAARLTGWGTTVPLRGVPGSPDDDVRAARALFPATTSTGTATSTPPAAPPPRDRTATRRRLLGAAALLLPTTLVATLLLAGGDPPPPAAAPGGTYVFAPDARPDGLVVERRWELAEGGRLLRATTVVRNSTATARTGVVDEVVTAGPPGFTPPPDEVVVPGRVVRYHVRSLAPYGRQQWGYVVRLALAPASLTALAGEADRARLAHEVAVRTAEVRASPSPG